MKTVENYVYIVDYIYGIVIAIVIVAVVIGIYLDISSRKNKKHQE